MHEDTEAQRRHTIKVQTADKVNELKQKENAEKGIQPQEVNIQPVRSSGASSNTLTDVIPANNSTISTHSTVANNPVVAQLPQKVDKNNSSVMVKTANNTLSADTSNIRGKNT
jgi:hypothetical protein